MKYFVKQLIDSIYLDIFAFFYMGMSFSFISILSYTKYNQL